MTTPKHPLTTDFKRFVDEQAARLTEAIEWALDLVPHPIKAVLMAVDDALEVEGDEDSGPECMCRPFPGGLTLLTYDCTIHGEAEQ